MAVLLCLKQFRDFQKVTGFFGKVPIPLGSSSLTSYRQDKLLKRLLTYFYRGDKKMPRRYGNPLSSSSEEEQQERHAEQRQENSPRIVVPSMSRFGQGRGRIIRGLSVRERERGGDCCPCHKCTCMCHQNSSTSRNISTSCEVAQKRSLEKSKTLFLKRRFPISEEKMQLLTDGVSIKNVNKWFINYRYSMFSVLKNRAAKKIRSTTTEEEITRIVPKATRLAFKHFLVNDRVLNEGCYRTTTVFFRTWLDALKANENAEKAATEAVKIMDSEL